MIDLSKKGTSATNIGMGLATLAIVIVAPLIYSSLPESYLGPRTDFGMGLGITALALSMLSALYSMRRAHMKYRWGNLETWLRVHTYTGLLALLFALLHCDWRFQPGAATAALILLFFTDISGLIGWVFYMFAHSLAVSEEAGKLDSPDEIFSQMDKLQDSIDNLQKRLEKTSSRDEKILGEIVDEENKLGQLRVELKSSLRRESLIGIWMYVHFPLSMTFLVTACVHAFVTFYLL